MTECVRCHAKTQQHLCARCTNRCRQQLRDLAGLAIHLAESAVGQTRLGDIGRHSPYRSRFELDGEATVASQILPLPDDTTDPAEARQKRHQAALRTFLAAGGVNERASSLHTDITDMLTTWIRDLLETQGVDWHGNPHRIGDLCAWLIIHIRHLANHEAADEFCDELDQHLGHIRRIINRPTPLRHYGPCPEPAQNSHDDDCQQTHPHPCGIELRAHKNATTVTCVICHTEHDVQGLFERQTALIGQYSYTLAELAGTVMPALREYVPLRTMQHWAATGKLNPTGYNRDAEPRYQLADIRKLRDEKPQQAITGGAAHRRKRMA